MAYDALMQFLTRCFLVLILAMVAQLPADMGVKVDSDVFMSAFHYTDEDGVRCRVGSWENGPGWRVPGRDKDSMDEDDDLSSNNSDKFDDVSLRLVEQRELVAARWAEWKAHENTCGAHIPSVLCCVPKITPLEGWADGQPLQKMKPLPFNKGKKNQSGGSSSESMSL